MSPVVRYGRLDVTTDEQAQLAALLDADEHARAARFRFDADRRRFVVRRGRARQWLAAETGNDPARLAFTITAHGKPMLTDGPSFSLSHSGEMMMLAIADRAIGCDIERIDADLDWPPLARSFFARDEITALESLPDATARAAFFACWSRKEAFVKALGLGLSYPLDAFTVSVGGAPTLLAGGDGWRFDPTDPPPGYQAAVVIAVEE